MPPPLPGGLPTNDVDTPIAAVLIACYIALAAIHFSIEQRNKRELNRTFQPTMLAFNFCLTRVVALALRIAWASHPHNDNIRIAAHVLLGPGVDMIFVVNAIFAHRVWLGYQSRSQQRLVGPAMWMLRIIIACVAATVITLLTSTVIQLTLGKDNPAVDAKCKTAQRVGFTFFFIESLLPLPVALLAGILPRPGGLKLFGTGTMQTKLGVVAAAAAIASLSAGWRCGTMMLPNPPPQPMLKVGFFMFNFVAEMLVIILYAVARIDRLFYMEDEAPGHPATSSEETIVVEWHKAEPEKAQSVHSTDNAVPVLGRHT